MSGVRTAPVLAADFGSGTGGFLVFVVLFAAAVGLFVALSGSLKRMRANVASGEFAGERPRDEALRARREGTSGTSGGHSDGRSPIPGQSQGPGQ